MKLLLFSDIHCDHDTARSLVERAQEADVVIGAGDFATVRRGLQETIDVLKSIEKPTVLVPGNAETDEELTAACADWPSAHVLHGSGTRINGVEFFGLGGAVPETPFGSWSFDLSEERAGELLRTCPPRGVLVSHSPPLGVLDVDSSRRHLGSRSVMGTVEQRHPRLVVCGHIHASAAHSVVHGITTIVNAGPGGMWHELT